MRERTYAARQGCVWSTVGTGGTTYFEKYTTSVQPPGVADLEWGCMGWGVCGLGGGRNAAEDAAQARLDRELHLLGCLSLCRRVFTVVKKNRVCSEQRVCKTSKSIKNLK